MKDLSDLQLLQTLQYHNTQYRAGEPEISDAEYDAMVAELARRDPDNAFLHTVEPEPVTGKTVKLPERMLSTQKAYTLQEVHNWYFQVCKAAAEVGVLDIKIKATAKLDGFAAIDAGNFQATRGDGVEGTNITHSFDRGLQIYNGSAIQAMGKGEIVVNRKYFQEFLADTYENSRNVIAAVIKEGELDPLIKDAIACAGAIFVPFSELPSFIFTEFANNLCEDFLNDVWTGLVDSSYFDTDGLVFEVVDPRIKELMGATNHHYRWQIAYKRNTEFHDCKVTGITWQTARTGRITPVINIEPTRIGGVTVSNVTGHHAGNVLNNNIGEGAIVKVTRAGQVIPHIVGVVSTDNLHPITYPTTCPSCGSVTRLTGDNLLCVNTASCPAQTIGTIEFFFKTIGCCDGFGPKIIDQLVRTGVTSVADIYNIDEYAWSDIDGIGVGTAANLLAELERSKQTPIEDWKFLAAFSIPGVGRGGCEKLLNKFYLRELFHLTREDILSVEGFGEIMADALLDTLPRIEDDFKKLSPRFNIVSSKEKAKASGPLIGKTVVFTGTMVKGSREDMQTQAKMLGAKVSSSVSSKTDYLVCGDNVGANKTEAAKKHGVTTLSEQQYLDLIAA